MNLDEIRELILLLDQTSIAELEVQKDDYKIILRKSLAYNDNQVSHVSTPLSTSKLIPQEVADEAQNDRIVAVHAPMVGTFYNASSPDAKPFVQIGDHVSQGQTLCILEAMKLMNEIKAEFDGTIVDTAVGNSEAIEYDQVLFLIEKD
ncbi:MAG: acetyl-CoA carboxylase biotin carboxyl carrier protein [Syntrophomonas sp.]|nr:acetyl-CoA carboxylase biotin carboxyl carrier protein [Syntrophomonas sp.]